MLTKQDIQGAVDRLWTGGGGVSLRQEVSHSHFTLSELLARSLGVSVRWPLVSPRPTLTSGGAGGFDRAQTKADLLGYAALGKDQTDRG